MVKYCTECGYENLDEANFCADCGFPFDENLNPERKINSSKYFIWINSYKFLDKIELNKNKSFLVKREAIENRANKTELVELENGLNKWKGNNKLIDFDLSSRYKLLKIMSDYRNDNISEFIKPIVKNYYRIRENFKKRNTSILAHGLKPLNENEANILFNLTEKHAILYSKNIKNNMKFAEFPLFENDNNF